jgi:hypothetical protein
MYESYWAGLEKQIDQVFHVHPSLYDHRKEYPWLSGALGNPYSGIWFIAENPSLAQIERVQNPDGGPPTSEAQWWASRGDKLFRDMLVKNGFKQGAIESPGGWNCYITNVVKETDYASRWREKSQETRNQAADLWSPVLAWELANSQPKYVVVLGGPADTLLEYLSSKERIRLPAHEKIKHYAYIGQRAEGKLGPMHPDRVARYIDDFTSIRKTFAVIQAS